MHPTHSLDAVVDSLRAAELLECRCRPDLNADRESREFESPEACVLAQSCFHGRFHSEMLMSGSTLLAAYWLAAAAASAPAAAASPVKSSVKVWPSSPNPMAHPLHNRSRTPGAGFEIFTPIKGRRLPGWAALRLTDTDLDNMALAIDKYFTDFDCANALWPSSRIIFHP
jgi:hypothetical protein